MKHARPLSILAALALSLASLAYAAEQSPSAWPDRIVTMEELHRLTAFSLKVPGVVVKGGVRGPSILRVHVDTSGAVVKAVLLESCGNADLDEAAIHGMRAMKFRPYTVGGTVTEVSLVVPIHVPKQLGRTR